MTSNAIRSTLLGACVLAMVAVGVLHAADQPEPSLVPRSWDLDVSYQQPRPIAVKDAQGNTQWFWYMTYRVVNNTDQERFFSPEITIATDKGDLLPAGERVPARVYGAISDKLENPLLENPISLTGKILIGEDYARNTVAIWPAFEHDVDVVNVFMAGMSGETATIENPATGEEIVLRKTLQINFETPGTEVHPQRQTVKHAGDKWIMR